MSYYVLNVYVYDTTITIYILDTDLFTYINFLLSLQALGCICCHRQTGCFPCLMCATDFAGIFWGCVFCGSKIDPCWSCRMLLHFICAINCCCPSCRESGVYKYCCCNVPEDYMTKISSKDANYQSSKASKAAAAAPLATATTIAAK